MAAKGFEHTTFGVLIAEGALEIGDGYRAKNEELGGDGVMFLRAGHVRDTHIDFAGVERFFADAEERVRTKLAKVGDTIVTTKGNSTGRTSFVSDSMPRFVYSPHLSYWRSLKSDRVIGGFLRYWSRSEEFTNQLAGMKASTDMAPYLSLIDQKRLRITLPPIDQQESIAHILGTLDDKIDLNRRLSETLETMARALFKSWFVDFDPVRAKVEGRDPGLPKHLADLFPSRLVDSALGDIPEGWEVGVLGDVLAQRIDRCSPSEETRTRPYVPIECIAARSLLLAESKPGDDAQSSLTRFRGGDLLFGAMRPYFHKVAIAPFDGTTRTTVLVLQPYQAEDFAFATLLLHDVRTIEYATNHSTGSTIPYAVWQGSLDAMPAVLPPPALRRSFDQSVRPLLERIRPVFFTIQTLGALRDTLLPTLMSGELRVKETAKFA